MEAFLSETVPPSEITSLLFPNPERPIQKSPLTPFAFSSDPVPVTRIVLLPPLALAT